MRVAKRCLTFWAFVITRLIYFLDRGIIGCPQYQYIDPSFDQGLSRIPNGKETSPKGLREPFSSIPAFGYSQKEAIMVASLNDPFTVQSSNARSVSESFKVLG